MTAKMQPFWWFKAPTVPPPTEQIVNGGFETGDTTGWTCGGSTPYCSAETESPHSGSYCGRVNNADPASWIEQEFSPVLVSSIVTFEFYNRTGEGGHARAEITYSDDTTVTIVDTGTGWTWRQIDLKSALDPTKSVKKIRFYYLEAGNVLDIDDVSLIA